MQGSSRRSLLFAAALGAVVVVLAGAAFACTSAYRGVMGVSAGGGWGYATGANNAMNWCGAPTAGGANVDAGAAGNQQVVVSLGPAACGTGAAVSLGAGTYFVSYAAAAAYTGQTTGPLNGTDCMFNDPPSKELGGNNKGKIVVANGTGMKTFQNDFEADSSVATPTAGMVCVYKAPDGHAVPLVFL